MTAQEESHETKQGQDEDRHEPRFLVSTALKVNLVTGGQIIGEPQVPNAAPAWFFPNLETATAVAYSPARYRNPFGGKN